MKKMLPAIFASTLLGCATAPTYYHPGKSQADFDHDSYDCEHDAWQRTSDRGAAGNPILAKEYYHDCMTRKYGYTVGPKA